MTVIYIYCVNCTKFGQLILRKVIQTATRCHILRLKCTKFDFGWGSAPDPAGGAYSAPPDLLAAFKVIKFGGNQEPIYDFLLVIHSNLSPISHRY